MKFNNFKDSLQCFRPVSTLTRCQPLQDGTTSALSQLTVMAPQESDLNSGHDIKKKPRFSNKLSLKRRMRFDPGDIQDEIKSKKFKMMNGHNVSGGNSSGSGSGPTSSKFESGRFSSASASSNSTSTLGGAKSVSSSCSNSIASLCNLGNTCFLNSVLYTLRFTPGFLHNLHHLVSDLGLPAAASAGNEKSSSKDKKKQAAANDKKEANADQAETERIHDVIEQLHDLFRNMSSSDDHLLVDSSSHGSNASKEPIAPSNFLHAVGKMNSMFEGNQQQDAHELLIALLTMLRDIKIPPPGFHLNSDNLPLEAENELKTGNANSKKKSKKSFLTSNGHHGNGLKKMDIPPSEEPSSASAIQMPPPSEIAETDETDGSGENVSDFNFVRENFVGKTVFRTKCLECETSTYRSDKFINIDIPLNFDDNDLSAENSGFEQDSSKQLSVADLFLKQIMASETLRENNKYLCVECSRLNEAQRSVQYELLPKVLVLQLKRFTAATNKSAFMSKINDFIPTPFTMNCFCTQCLPPDAPLEFHQRPPKHHYRLFSVIMHLGATLASGHYIAYVRASVDLSLDYSRCPKANQTGSHDSKKMSHFSNGSSSSGNGSSGQKSRGIMKYFSRSDKEKNNINGLHNLNLNGSSDATDSSSSGAGSQNLHCRSANCCGMQRVLRQLNAGRNSAKSQESLNNGYNSASETDCISNNVEDVWLECDDENISLISRRQFEDELNSKQSATTPYLLFYERV